MSILFWVAANYDFTQWENISCCYLLETACNAQLSNAASHRLEGDQWNVQEEIRMNFLCVFSFHKL